ncbi:MAG: hypothetical protein B6D41_18930 [Chloroflexi bacterium UTCFX4]|nr:MAG: hypothetical protein B6D41_18930 [Chloroflexi bacterium UTCFX4]
MLARFSSAFESDPETELRPFERGYERMNADYFRVNLRSSASKMSCLVLVCPSWRSRFAFGKLDQKPFGFTETQKV